ncbi:MAG: hypothetical protein PF795_06870 [Kiritimatiellae bacterium]|jgi:hypothetical protein|nr:hypothetical protein [Kiritimatiellia bacterium]
MKARILTTVVFSWIMMTPILRAETKFIDIHHREMRLQIRNSEEEPKAIPVNQDDPYFLTEKDSAVITVVDPNPVLFEYKSGKIITELTDNAQAVERLIKSLGELDFLQTAITAKKNSPEAAFTSSLRIEGLDVQKFANDIHSIYTNLAQIEGMIDKSISTNPAIINELKEDVADWGAEKRHERLKKHIEILETIRGMIRRGEAPRTRVGEKTGTLVPGGVTLVGLETPKEKEEQTDSQDPVATPTPTEEVEPAASADPDTPPGIVGNQSVKEESSKITEGNDTGTMVPVAAMRDNKSLQPGKKWNISRFEVHPANASVLTDLNAFELIWDYRYETSDMLEASQVLVEFSKAVASINEPVTLKSGKDPVKYNSREKQLVPINFSPNPDFTPYMSSTAKSHQRDKSVSDKIPFAPLEEVQLSIGGGFVFSFVDNSKFSTKESGGEFTVAEDKESLPRARPAVMLNMAFEEWNKNPLQGYIQMGVTPESDELGLYLGVGASFYDDRLTVGFGVAYEEVRVLQGGLSTGATLDKKEDLKTSTDFETGFYLYLGGQFLVHFQNYSHEIISNHWNSLCILNLK